VTVLTLHELRDRRAQLVAMLPLLEEAWRIAGPNVYERPRHGRGGGPRSTTRPCGKCKGKRGVVIEGKKIPCPECLGEGSFEVTDDTVGEVYIATDRLRSHFIEGSRQIEVALRALRAALESVNDGLPLIEPPPTVELAEAVLRENRESQMNRLRTRVYQELRQSRDRGERETGGVRSIRRRG